MQKKLTTEDFVHLHNHTEYSLLDGLTKIPALIDSVKAMGMQAVAITDHGTMSGAVEFYRSAKDGGVKPVIGIETYIAPRKHTDKDPTKDKTPYHLTVLAMNNKGYENLMRLSTIANLEGFYYRPRVDRELLSTYSEGLIILSGCIGGEVGDHLRNGQYKKAKSTAQWYKKVFGDRYYLEVQDHGHEKHPSAWDEQVEVTKQTLRLADELGIECVLTCDAHYLRHKDQEAHEILLCVQTGSFLSDEGRMSLKNLELHVSDPKEIIKRWGNDRPEIISNTKLVADRCSVELELGKILIPKFPVPKGESEKSYLETLVFRGLSWRYGNITENKANKLSVSAAKQTLSKEIIERAEYELGVIGSMKFAGYFLIISDFVNWGKKRGIVFGPGRGSAAGSIISYSLKITEIDPLEHDLLFERFLNPDRISMPDIDIDIQDSRRDEVIQYCVDKYGSDRVANIATFGRMAARNAVRDVSRVLQVPYAEADRLAKMIPPPIQGRHIPLAESLKTSTDLKKEYRTNEQTKKVFDLAVQLEGTIRSHGVHAAGVVIAPDDIVNFVPLEMAQKGVIATQYSMGPIEDLGLLKIDFLGLANLTIIKNALRIIKRVHGKSINIENIPMDNAQTFELLAKGDTTGVFQLESAGMKRYLKELKPSTFDDIIAMVALYRPGPMQWIEDFVARKHGSRKIEYAHPVMKAALENTYGIIVYQEQVMQIAKDLCGFSGGQADTLRKAIGKKKRDVMARMKQEFVEGAINTTGVKQDFVEKLWAELEKFADYAFPKAHAACYALIAYWTAYLKAHYPAEFMAALMTSDYDNTDRLAIEIDECKHIGIEVLPPNVNESFIEFAVTPESKQIRFGLAAIKNVGAGAVEEILRVRESEGRFKNLEDFFGQVSPRLVNRKTIESLIKTGAFDDFEDRVLLLSNIDLLLAYASNKDKRRQSGQTDLFGNQSDDNGKSALILDGPKLEFTDSERMQWERELLGIYLSQHPLEKHRQLLAKRTSPLNELKAEHDGKSVSVGGLISDIREITTKNGQKMAFIKLVDDHGEAELILFPKTYAVSGGLWQKDSLILARGKVTAKDKAGNILSDIKILVDSAEPLEEKNNSTIAESIPRVYIKLDNGEDHSTLMSLKKTIDENQGSTEVVLVINSENRPQIIKLPAKIEQNDKALASLKELVGQDNVKVK